ncbi:ADP-glyceromanno-heptose 6-epimerase [Paraburkholderia kirstenboschensis]|uniref:ADP-L-glycero-D-manno-heptose-6-epimerase n=1 Tax=Paraburkholderia kirstenboschensis TaxID=1245436 RepID=A0ABZ0ETZ8_9BURK|nr:ADP-glyceromanno-heptose 6-epimerase [Paraburkholderia kirstenboschensis]WOD19892.1 ADP-glyceromanno-heptose 6-epimerase [Paraburkholderia kirstenboschensis]
MSERIIVTGAAGFVGSNIVRGLNARGITNVIAVDNLTSADKFHNLVDLQISDYSDKSTFYEAFASGRFGHVDAVFHEGACSDTMQHDGRYMLDNNYASSKTLLDACMATGTRLFYASSAATYGGSSGFIEHPAFERPLNVYGYSKLLFDQVVRRALPASRSQIAGFRYFNVYGPGEQHKGRMASVAYHHFNQFRAAGKVQLFGSYGGYGPGEQMRDFVFIDDVVAVNLWFFDHPDRSGVFNLGSGRAQPFNDVALSTVNAIRASQKLGALGLDRMVAERLIEYVEFPRALHGKYQCFTEANLSNLRAVGCDHVFADVGKGVSAYVERLLGLEKDAATL